MQTIIHSPLPIRNMKEETYYFARNKDNLKEVVAYRTSIYKVGNLSYPGDIVFLFSKENSILWITEEAFNHHYNITGEVNKMEFK